MDLQVEGRSWRRPMLEIKLNLLLFESIKVILDIITFAFPTHYNGPYIYIYAESLGNKDLYGGREI